jgi:isopenicillin-N epimerase
LGKYPYRTIVEMESNTSVNGNHQDLPPTSEYFKEWPLRPDIVHLDHGSCGGCPHKVRNAQRKISDDIEYSPPSWFGKNYASGLRNSKEALAGFLNANVAGLAIMPGTTQGLNAAVFSQHFNAGDELLITNHAYSSALLILRHIAEQVNARVVIANVPFPVKSEDEVVESILSHVTPKAKFAIIDHIPSRTGVIFPIKRIVAELDSRDVVTLVDGAHGPGQIEVDLRDINAPYYVASLHKWMCAPRGLGLLYVREDKIASTKPVIVARTCYYRDSHAGVHTQFEHDFDWIGTFDPSTYLSLPAIVDFLSTVLPGGHRGLVQRNHHVALEARKIIHRELGIPPASPDEMLGSMVTFPLPDTIGPESPQGTLPLQKKLMEHSGIEAQVYNWPQYPKRVMRLSIQAHNSIEQIEYLARHLKAALEAEKTHLNGTNS